MYVYIYIIYIYAFVHVDVHVSYVHDTSMYNNYYVYANSQTVQFKSYLLSVGIANPVTKVYTYVWGCVCTYVQWTVCSEKTSAFVLSLFVLNDVCIHPYSRTFWRSKFWQKYSKFHSCIFFEFWFSNGCVVPHEPKIVIHYLYIQYRLDASYNAHKCYWNPRPETNTFTRRATSVCLQG